MSPSPVMKVIFLTCAEELARYYICNAPRSASVYKDYVCVGMCDFNHITVALHCIYTSNVDHLIFYLSCVYLRSQKTEFFSFLVRQVPSPNKIEYLTRFFFYGYIVPFLSLPNFVRFCLHCFILSNLNDKLHS